MTECALGLKAVLVVEDEFFLAMDLEQELRRAGAAVVGPAPTLANALRLIEQAGPLDGAVLDINLSGELVFPVADLLRQRGVPFLFTTGYDRSAIPARFADVPWCEKPVDAHRVCRHLAALLGLG